MQTKQQIEQILATIGAKPDKKLGQNFLYDLNLIRLFLDQANIKKDDIVIEIGPGTGVLTDEIAKLAGGFVTVEYDKLLSKFITERFKGMSNVTVISGDALKTKNQMNEELVATVKKYQAELTGKTILVANIPYNIAASAMANLITSEPFVDEMYVTIQKEVGQRMASGPNDELYGPLSIIIQATGRVEIIRTLPKNVFWPAPNVESAMVSYVKDKDKFDSIDNIAVLKEIILLFMGHRRKTLRACTKFATGSFSNIKWDDIFEESCIESGQRGENLSPEQYVMFSNIVNLKLNI